MTTKRAKGGAGFAKRQTAAAEARRVQEQRRTIYGVVGAVAVVILIFALWQVLRPGDQSVESGSAATGSTLTGDRPLAALTPEQRNDYYSAYPEMVIDTAKRYEAVIRTVKGDVRIELFDDIAPLTVNNFVFLANEGFYDGLTFHRVLADFMAQGGDPTGRGAGGPGYRFEDEIDSSLTFDRAGLLAMANSGRGTNGSQFFITFAPTPWLNRNHTIFGEVIEGSDVLAALTLRDPEQNPTFTGDVMERVEIVAYDK